MTPFGLFQEIGEAVELCMKRELDVDQNVVPVSVAIDNTGFYEVCNRF